MNIKKHAGKKTVYILGTNHFDPIWRRGFKKPFYYRNEKYVACEKIQEACISDWLLISKGTDSKFEIECSLVLRTFLGKHPEQLDYIKRLAQDGRFELRASGEVIPDTNMPSGETLVRNLVYGILWGEQTLGVSVTTGCLNDAFGSSAQLPQIFKGCGVDMVIGLSYRTLSGKYWKGLDGSIIRFLNNPGEGFGKYLDRGTYYKPCPVCKGEGCNTCSGRGFDQSYRMGGEPDSIGLDLDKHPFGIIFVGGEETMASMDLAQRVESAQKNSEEIEYKFGLFKDIIKEHYEDELEFTDKNAVTDISPDVEANPSQTGCYVSRIKIKQNIRRLENSAMSIEKLAAIAYLNCGEYPIDKLTDTWKNIAFAAFHDNITGTHVDVGYEELMETFKNCDENLRKAQLASISLLVSPENGTITVFNPHAFEVTDYVGINTENAEKMYIKAEKVPPFGFKTYKLSDCKANCSPIPKDSGQKYVENEYYRISVDEHGITGIFDKEYDKKLIPENYGYANELILEHDFGDPWSTREASRPRTRLGRMNNLTGVKRFGSYSEIHFKGEFRGNENILCDPADYRVLALEWEQKITLWDSLKRVDFETSIYWSSFDRRIRISFPTYMREDDGFYAVPYGTLKRSRYDLVDIASVTNPDGDWPSVEWFSTAKEKSVNIALLNRGTPSSRIERGELMISVLRSPTFPGGGLLWPKVYDAPVYDGMRDQGNHTFEYSLTSFYDKWGDSDVVRKAYQYNSKLMAFEGSIKKAANLTIKADGTEIAAFKKAEQANALIIRLNEYRGKSETVEISLPSVKKAYEANMLEKNIRELPVENDKIKIKMEPFKIKTIKLEINAN
jgi:alpha-mannosidase